MTTEGQQPAVLDLDKIGKTTEMISWYITKNRWTAEVIHEACRYDSVVLDEVAIVLNALPQLLALAREAAGLKEAAAGLAPYLTALLTMADPDGDRVSDDLAAANDVYLRASDVKALLEALKPAAP